ncbi:HU family DNA-binding protein [Roseovarius aquimarinus]|uniref:HU family DNA-binding protein n=1 Tax=Roseovarius aquimarinus TaxID=1229156 RepID=A0ABW7I3H8_9RHOB
MKSKSPKTSRASAMPPKPPAPLRAQGSVTTMVPKPPLAVAKAAPAQGGAKSAPQAVEKTNVRPAKPAQATDEAGAEQLKKQELISLVVERSGVAKKHAKPVIEAMLEVLGASLAEGRELNLQPMGKIKRKRVKETPQARVIVANIRQPSAAVASIPAGVATAASIPDAAIDTSTAPLRHPLKEAVAEGSD